MQNSIIPAEIHQEIMKRLEMTEKEENVRILFADVLVLYQTGISLR